MLRFGVEQERERDHDSRAASQQRRRVRPPAREQVAHRERESRADHEVAAERHDEREPGAGFGARHHRARGHELEDRRLDEHESRLHDRERPRRLRLRGEFDRQRERGGELAVPRELARGERVLRRVVAEHGGFAAQVPRLRVQQPEGRAAEEQEGEHEQIGRAVALRGHGGAQYARALPRLNRRRICRAGRSGHCAARRAACTVPRFEYRHRPILPEAACSAARC